MEININNIQILKKYGFNITGNEAYYNCGDYCIKILVSEDNYFTKICEVKNYYQEKDIDYVPIVLLPKMVELINAGIEIF